MITGLLLAAGAAKRFGAPKLLQDLGGKPVLRWSAERLRQCVDDMIVVVPRESVALQEALEGVAARFVINPHPELEIASSIACGVAAVGDTVDAVLVALGDEPAIDRRAMQTVIDTYRARHAKVVAPTYDGVRGHPVLFDRSTFAELRVFGGRTSGARQVVDRDPERTMFVEIGTAAPVDVDTPEDLARLRAEAQFSPRPQPSSS